MEEHLVADTTLSSFDVEEIPIETLLFQTGYLTIKEITTIGTQYAYILIYPNLEFKLTEYGSAAEAIEQIKTRNYAAKYLASGKPIYLLGIAFDETIRNIAEIISEKSHS